MRRLAGLGADTTLPSVTAAEAFWRKEPGAMKRIGLSMLERGAIIGGALWLAGERQRLLRYTLAATVAVEAIVLWQVKRQLDALNIAPPPAAPKTIQELAAQQKAMAYAALKDKWTDAEVFNIYLSLSKRRLPVLLPDDFTDTEWGRKWMDLSIAQVVADDPGDLKLRETTINYLNDVWAKLKMVVDQTCTIAPDLCRTIADGSRA